MDDLEGISYEWEEDNYYNKISNEQYLITKLTEEEFKLYILREIEKIKSSLISIEEVIR